MVHVRYVPLATKVRRSGGTVRLSSLAAVKLRLERHAGAAADRPYDEVLAPEPADFAANQELGAANRIVADTGRGPRRPALHKLRGQQQCGVIAGEVIVGVKADVG